MSFNGSGTFNINTAGQPVVNGTTITDTAFNALIADLASGLTNAVTRDGQSPATANLPMGNNKHTGVSDATARTHYCSAGQAQDNTFDWLTSVSGADTITASAAIGMAAYAAGQCFRFASVGANTGAVTLNVNSLGAKSVTKNGTTALSAGDIPSGAAVELIYDGTRFQLVGIAIPTAVRGTTTNDSSAAGYVGEFVTSSVALGASVALTTGTQTNITSISLTAGDWDVWGSIGSECTNAGTSVTVETGSISQTSATHDATNQCTIRHAAIVYGLGSGIKFSLERIRISLASTTTIYLVAQHVFTVSTLGGYGTLSARRVR